MFAYLGIGTNLGDKATNINQCLCLLEKEAGTIVRRSNCIESSAWGFASEHTFLNMVVCINTPLSPYQLLETTQQIEQEMGRTDKTVNGLYHDRLIDIDILLYEDYHITSPELTIPHPLITKRPFVYRPLKEILPHNHFFMQNLLQE